MKMRGELRPTIMKKCLCPHEAQGVEVARFYLEHYLHNDRSDDVLAQRIDGIVRQVKPDT